MDLTPEALDPKDIEHFESTVAEILTLQPKLNELFVAAHDRFDNLLVTDLALLQGLTLLTNDIVINIVRHMRLSEMKETEIKEVMMSVYRKMLQTYQEGHKTGIEISREEIVKEKMRQRQKKLSPELKKPKFLPPSTDAKTKRARRMATR
ncbi:hypothetical protein HY496_02020 [Candidatus Woesearchaeota archaeon]|nr:hypothetical protein [Candidatus Woesearchaeota archaeon]